MTSDSQHIKLLSWNIWGCKYLPKVIRFLKKADADIIALQEVEESGSEDNTARSIAGKLGYHYIYARSFRYDEVGRGSFRGNAVLSRLAITKSHMIPLSEEKNA